MKSARSAKTYLSYGFLAAVLLILPVDANALSLHAWDVETTRLDNRSGEMSFSEKSSFANQNTFEPLEKIEDPFIDHFGATSRAGPEKEAVPSVQDGPEVKTTGPPVSLGPVLPGIASPFGGSATSGYPADGPRFGENKGASPRSWLALQKAGNQEKESASPQCNTDDDCKTGYFCSHTEGMCKKVQRRVNIAYLFYLSGDRRFLSVLGMYMHRRGRRGFRMAFPFYWHFWGKQHDAKVVFPIFGRFKTAEHKRTDTVVGPFHHWKSERGTGFNIWPFMFYSDYGKRGSRFTLLPLGHYERDDKHLGYGFLTPLGFYYGSASPRHQTWAMVPWAFGTATPEKAFTWTFPLNFYRRRGHDRKWYIMPFGYGRRKGPLHRTFAFPLVWVWGDEQRTNVVGFPLVWHFARPGRSTTVVLPFYHSKRGRSYSGGLVPLLFYGGDHKTGTRHVTLAPLFHWSSSKQGRATRFYSLLFNRAVDRDRKSSTWVWTIPPMVSHRSGRKGLDVAFGLFWRYFNKNTGTKAVSVPPFLYYRDRSQQNSFLFPLWWSFKHRDTRAYSRAFFPLFYQQRSAEGRTLTVAGPAYLAQGGRKNWHAGLAPLLFFGSGRDSHHAVVFPLLWHFKNDKAQTTVTGPLYWARRKDRWHAGTAPLFFMGRGRDYDYATLFPLLWYVRDRKEPSNTLVAGPLYTHWGAEGWRAGLAPLFFFGDKGGRSHQIVAPLFGHWHDKEKDERTVVAGPSYYWRRSENWGWGLAPFVFFRRNYDDGYVSSETTVLPFFHHRRSRNSEFLATPLGGFMKRPDRFQGVIGPVVWQRTPNRRAWAILPWIFHWNYPKAKSSTTIAFPFIRQTQPGSSATVLVPFYWRFKDQTEKSTVLFPFYWRLRQKKGWKADVFFPFYWNLKKQERHLFMIPPFYAQNTKETYTAGFWPLVHYRRNKKHRKTWLNVFPLLWYTRDDKNKTHFLSAGPFYSSKSPEKSDKGLVPLLFWGNRGSKSYRIGFPLFWDFADREAKKRTMFAGPFFYHRRGHARGGGIFPVIWGSADAAGMRHLTLAPLFHVKRDPTRFTFYTGLFGLSRDKATGAHHGYVGPYGWRSDSKRRHDVFFPFYWRFKNKELEKVTSFIPPLLYWGRHSPESKVDLVFPFVWSSRRITGRTTVVFPFWWDKHEYYESRTTAVFPLFYRKRNYAEESSTWLFPPSLYYKRSPERTQAVLFPIIWHFSRKRTEEPVRSTTIGFPLYWDFRRADSRTTIAFPLFWYFDRPDQRTVVVLNTIYRRSKEDNSYNLHCIPFFQVGRPRPGDINWNVLGGLVGYQRIGRNRMLRLLFIPIEMTPLPPKKPQQADGKQTKKDRPSRSSPRDAPQPVVPAAQGQPSFSSSGTWTPF